MKSKPGGSFGDAIGYTSWSARLTHDYTCRAPGVGGWQKSVRDQAAGLAVVGGIVTVVVLTVGVVTGAVAGADGVWLSVLESR